MILKKNSKAQSTIEFAFAMVVMIFLIYGLVQVFRWAGLDLSSRRVSEDLSMTCSVNPNPAVELNPYDDFIVPMAAVYHGKITNGNEIP